MCQNWKITVWGVRGSAPRPADGYLKFGGNTVCTSLEYGEELVILDAGSGLSVLGQTLTSPKTKRISILLGHLHLDHLMGLFSFPPLFDPEMEIHIYARSGAFWRLNSLFGPPFWPVGFSDFPARICFHDLQPEEPFSINSLKGYTVSGNHPGGSLLYRLEDGNKSLTYTLDCEADDSVFPALAEFSHKTSLLIWDACFVSEDMHTGWGHSSWEQGVRLRKEAQAEMVLMTHYNWNYSDSFLSKQEALALQKDSACFFAKEGMVITL